MNKPTLITSFEDFDRKFSSETAASDLARSVKLFFANGGNRAYVVRIADSTTVQAATSTLHSEGNAPSLAIEAKSPGIIGDTIRIAVDYDTSLPETTFNMTVFRWDTNSSGALEQAQLESHINLSMDTASSRYVENIVNRDSQLISINDLVSMAEKIGGVTLKRTHDLNAPTGVAGRNSDNTFIQKVLGWAPSLPLEEGMKRTYKWIEQQYQDRKAGKRTVS